VSLCYENATCTLEEDSATDDVIGGPYRPDRRGVGGTHGVADHLLDGIPSVSIRRADDLAQQACGSVRQQR
jgi:hypothetical protein